MRVTPRVSLTCIHPFPDKFPPELADAVIDQLHGDASSLRACALTSSSWLPTSRYHLFNDVYFEDEVTIFRWIRAFRLPSNVPAYVENLHISCVSLLGGTPSAALDFSTFSRLKGLFIGDNKISPTWHRRPHWNCFRRIALFPSKSLRTFSLSSPKIPVPDIFSVVCHFPRLENLHLRCFYTLSSGSEDIKTETSPSFRGTLTLASHLNCDLLVTNLLEFPSGLHFSHVNLTTLRDDELPNLRILVNICSHTITSLHFTIDLGKWHLPVCNS